MSADININNKTAEDSDIIRRFFDRDESALSDVNRKYGSYCSTIARNILGNEQSAEECVNDTLMRLWESIPPAKPSYLPAFVGKIVRNIALNNVRRENALKRGGGEIDIILDEAEEMISSGDSVELTAQRHEIMAAVNEWLETIPAKKRAVFVLRYWHCKSVSEVAQCVGISQTNVENVLKRERKKLVEYMKGRGF
ncbi:MAG: sigma-70 family RNA polymerase sigma factor [Oscillospiraceae bacterium]|nr:sigma-70 family RNA polymerase sigma factor [Oscillospiraceae bacterium]